MPYDPISLWLHRRKDRRKYARWLRTGRPMPPPHLAKQLVMRDFIDRYGLKVFVETGTFQGNMVESVKGDFDELYSIELSDGLFERAARRFRHDSHVHILHGDSGKVLPELIKKITRPTLFWLDGHYSGGRTACGEKETPVSEELNAILNHPVPGHVILIDDARCFTGKNDYPTVEKLRETILARRPDHRFEVETDILRIYKPPAA